MSYLLKEALKTLCGVNQWSYAVLWKISLQNPRLLIWEECYQEPSSESGFLEQNVHFLVNKMMLNNHVVILGEGLIGRSAFTGDYQWILYDKFYSQSHPLDVQKEVFQQFLDGMHTIAVVPILPHGVIQFGSSFSIPENVEFLNEVNSLILHFGCVYDDLLLSENYTIKGDSPRLESSVFLGYSTPTCSSLEFVDPQSSYSDQASIVKPQSSSIQNELLPNFVSFPEVKLECSSSNEIFKWSSKAFDPVQENVQAFCGNNSRYYDPFGYRNDDLFDILGADFKNKLVSGYSNTSPKNEPVLMEGFEYSSSYKDALGIEENSDISGSCKTTLTNTRTFSQCSVSRECSKRRKASCKRLKPGENPRPRPKDRQMIQDRVKELREIIPNGTKCSIDSLLERTIKHMLFLQSVMKHSDKLKQSGQSTIISKDNFEGGATWAYELGSQSLVPPIVVENLHQPHQMRVEMLCEERGLFLEIADVIRGLGLTILKGIIEPRNDKIWARFFVEANRDITRMEIFISLVHLLEQDAKNMNFRQFHSVAPVPEFAPAN